MSKFLIINNIKYDITNFNHPGGEVINYYSNKDATDVYNAFHHRSLKSDLVLKNLPIINNKSDFNSNLMLEDFNLLRQSLIDRGFYKPNYWMLGLFILDILFFFGLGVYLISKNIFLSLLAFSLSYGKCGWLNHEAGHNSLTGNIKMDKFIQSLSIGIGLSMHYNSWNLIHNKHHACTQKINNDLDTDSIIAYFIGAVEKNKFVIKNKYWLRFQVYNYFLYGIFIVFLFLKYVDHPRQMIRDKDYKQIIIAIFSYIGKILLFMYFGDYTFTQSLLLYHCMLWFTSLYLFGHFTLSHSSTDIVDENTDKNWVEYAFEHTIDISPDNLLVCWFMGYLNCQTVHHLFPSLQNFRQSIVSKELLLFAKKWNIKYTICTYKEIWIITLKNLNNVGKYYYKKL
jgi:fatty acid desaturase 2 (delta-6 desaturase)